MTELVSRSNKALIISYSLDALLVYQYVNRKESISSTHKLIAVLSGLYLADLLSGIVHVTFDRETNYPAMKQIVSDFQRHHLNPIEITKQSVLELFRQSTFTPGNVAFLLYNSTKIFIETTDIESISICILLSLDSNYSHTGTQNESCNATRKT
jgi:hypothetical protein